MNAVALRDLIPEKLHEPIEGQTWLAICSVAFEMSVHSDLLRDVGVVDLSQVVPGMDKHVTDLRFGRSESSESCTPPLPF